VSLSAFGPEPPQAVKTAMATRAIHETLVVMRKADIAAFTKFVSPLA
jgi:hypothetical protein